MLSPVQHILAICLLPGTASGAYWKLIDSFGSAANALSQSYQSLSQLLSESALVELVDLEKHGCSSTLFQRVEREQQLAADNNIEIIYCEQDSYPALLREIAKPPPLLYVKGNCVGLSVPQIAVVGSRRPTPLGKELAFDFSRQLVEQGFVITSGLALGIDGCAHRGAIAAQSSLTSTNAVLGSGLLHLYPKRNIDLANNIIDSGGALISEFPLLTGPLRENFPRRNRVVSGLSCGTLVVEAALKSGSLITARYALQQNREVFAIPGSIRSEVSKGCHAMIKSGAKLVEQPKDIICELESILGFHQQQLDFSTSCGEQESSPESNNKDDTGLLAHIGFEPTAIDTLTERTGKSVDHLALGLLELEMQGKIENTGLGYVRI